MRTVQAILIACLGVLPALGAACGVAQPVAGLRALAAEAWYAEPEAGMLLVATRELQDPLFSRSVILLLSHSAAGAQGLIVNQHSDWRLSDVLSGIESTADIYPVFFGGPLGVHQVFMLLRGSEAVPGASRVSDDIWFSDSRRVLDDLMADPVPAGDLHFYLGYASWITGQLEAEISGGSWLLIKGDTHIVFDAGGGNLWKRLIDELEPNGILVSADPVREEPGPRIARKR